LSEEKKYKNYTAADIEKYHKGLLSPGEMNELEKAALDDPFLADALEGYQATAENISSDLSELEKKLAERVSDRKVISIGPPGASFKWWKVAAAVVILGGAGYFVVQLSNNNKSNSVAVKMEEKKSIAPAPSILADSNKLVTVESTGVTGTDKRKGAITKSGSEKKDSLTSYSFSLTEKNDEAAGVISPSEASADYKLKADSLNRNESTTQTSAPVALEKRPAAANKKFSEAYSPSKEESVLNEQERTNYFRGRVKDANNNPLPFANITNTKDNVGTYADAKGNFTLISPDSVLDVQVRSVGFENNIARLKNNASNDVVMRDDQSTPAKVLSYQKPDSSRSRAANVKVEELEPADGWNNYNVYLANNINVPEDLKRKEELQNLTANGANAANGVTGQVRLSFEINKQGDPINIKVEKSLCEKCDEEAVRVVKQGPKWKKKNKKAKRITISVPFDTEQ